MAIARLQLDRKLVGDSITNMLGKSEYVKQETDKYFGRIFNNARRSMIRAFDTHDVTQEIKAGPEAANITDTTHGEGNLFSFLGFSENTDPTAPLRQLLLEGTYYRQTVYRNRGWYFQVYTPSREEIRRVTPLEWEQGNSWAFGIEQGISNLGFYIFTHWEGGRSKEGVQLNTEANKGGWEYTDLVFKPTPYISEILSNFREKVESKVT